MAKKPKEERKNGILEYWVILLSVVFILPIIPSFDPSIIPELSF